ncbi:MAG: hypothetical protein ACYCOU_20825, partial [Sulfobacillus sp.]
MPGAAVIAGEHVNDRAFPVRGMRRNGAAPLAVHCTTDGEAAAQAMRPPGLDAIHILVSAPGGLHSRPVRPARRPVTHTAAPVKSRARLGNWRHTMAADGALMAGRVSRSVYAGPSP